MNKKPKDYTKNFILAFAGISTAVCFVYIFLITFIKIPVANQRYADICLGFLLGTFLATIIQFFYGSTQTSKEKDSVLHIITKRNEELKKKLISDQNPNNELEEIEEIDDNTDLGTGADNEIEN